MTPANADAHSSDVTTPGADAGEAADAAIAPMIDWRLAESTALKLMPSRPTATADEAREVVDGLRRAALEAEQPIADVTMMVPTVPRAPVRVVDRATWARLNVGDMAAVMDPLVAVLREKRRRASGEAADSNASGSATGNAVATAIGSRATGFQVGSLMAFVGTKVLGQHELFTPSDRGAQLLLVAPNVMIAERNLGVDPAAFRRWVCLHEETHRVQLATVPWLRGHIENDLQRFFDATDTETPLSERIAAVVGSVGGALRGSGSGSSLVEAVQTPEQREILDRLVALMTLLEGHADWAMDAVGEEIVPGLADVRARFEKRRSGGGTFDQVLRRLFGMDAKLAQYRDGAAFVRDVVKMVGVEGLNAVWSSADALPMREEIADARRWADRVLTGYSA